MSNYPSGIDDGTTLPNPLAGSFTNNPDHAVLHGTENDAIKMVEIKLGTGVSTATTGTVLRGTGSGTTAFAQANLTTDVTGTLPVANGGTGVTTSTGSTNVVLSGSPTIVTPTIASFTNATHTHQNSAGGGTLAESALILTDVTTNDVSTSKHGFTSKAPNDTTKFLRGDASWGAVPQILIMGLYVLSPSDAVTYYNTATGFQSSTTVGFSRVYIPRACTITSCYLWSGNPGGTAGSSETSTVSIRLNGTTDTTISSAVTTNTQPGALFTNTSLSVALIVGDYIELKWVAPTWVTNPSNIAMVASLGLT